MYHIKAIWDDEARVWVAESEEVPGLVAEAASLDGLKAKLDVLIPELLAANGRIPAGQKSVEIPIQLVAEYQESVRG